MMTGMKLRSCTSKKDRRHSHSSTVTARRGLYLVHDSALIFDSHAVFSVERGEHGDTCLLYPHMFDEIITSPGS